MLLPRSSPTIAAYQRPLRAVIFLGVCRRASVPLLLCGVYSLRACREKVLMEIFNEKVSVVTWWSNSQVETLWRRLFVTSLQARLHSSLTCLSASICLMGR